MKPLVSLDIQQSQPSSGSHEINKHIKLSGEGVDEKKSYRPKPNVVLVSMPWTTAVQPSLGLAILKATLLKDQIPCQIYHASLDLLKYMKLQTYETLARCWAVNDFLFARLLDDVLDDSQLDNLRTALVSFAMPNHFSDYTKPAEILELIFALRNHVLPRYLAECATFILNLRPTLVGFSCLFDQTIASVALAKLLKEAEPTLTTVLGGYAVQHANGAEFLRSFPFIDCIVKGDGEPVISQLAWASVGVSSLNEINGVVTNGALADNNAPESVAIRADLSQALTPDYHDWFQDLHRLARDHKVFIETQGLPIESSRGCWWGQKSHCTFCGIDEETLRYRSKSAAQIVNELRELRNRHGENMSFRFADYILPHRFHDQLLPGLAEFKPPLRLEGEIKANQTRERVRRFASAGFRALQPGIESFSSEVLQRIHKGVNAIQNIQLLKWGYLEQIITHYNLIFGFPGETLEEYTNLVATLPRLYHLIPPHGHGAVAITRFAPLQAKPAKFGIASQPTHHHFYDIVFSRKFLQRTGFSMDNYCYYFERDYEIPSVLQERYAQLVIQTEHWKEQQKQRDVYLTYEQSSAGYSFIDTRYSSADHFEIVGLPAEVYSRCDERAVTKEELVRQLCLKTDKQLTDLCEAIHILDFKRLIWTDGDSLFGLGVPAAVARGHIRDGWKFNWGSLYT